MEVTLNKNRQEVQQEANNAAIKEFNFASRATIVMPCGSGKSWVGSSIAAEMKPKSVIALFPSLALLKQALAHWKETKPLDGGFSYLCVCSDKTVAVVDDDEDDIVFRDEDLPVSTSSDDVATFLGTPSDMPKVIFSTYQSALVVGEGMPEGFVFDYGLFDEAHKTAGAMKGRQFSYALTDKNIPIDKRLFMTATPRHFRANKKNQDGDMEIAYSMDNEAVYGKVVYKLSHREAIRLGIISDYKILISVVTTDMAADWIKQHDDEYRGRQTDARAIASMIAMQKAVEKYGVKKIFSFHTRVADAQAFSSSHHVAECLPGFTALHVNGAQTAQARQKTIDDFENARDDFGNPRGALLTNAKCLTEGVDVPAVDMVAFMSPKKSTVDIVQATGRATRTYEGKSCGYILLPLFVENTNKESIEEALSRSDFTTIVDTLEAMKEQDEEFCDVLTTMRERKGRKGGAQDASDKTTADGLVRHLDIIASGIDISDIRAGITRICIDQVTESWDEMFGRLKGLAPDIQSYRSGTVESPPTVDQKLQSWCNQQRYQYAKGVLRQDRIRRLESIHFVWTPKITGPELLNELRVIAERNRAVLLSTLWKSSRDYYDFQLPNGEIVHMRADTLKECGWPKDIEAFKERSAGRTKSDEKRLRELAALGEPHGAVLLSTVWKSNKDYYDFQLPNGEIVPMRVNTLKECGWPKDIEAFKERSFTASVAQTKSDEERLRELAALGEPHGAVLLSTVWKLSRSRYDFQLPDGQIVSIQAVRLKRAGWPKDIEAFKERSFTASVAHTTRTKSDEERLRELAALGEPHGAVLLSTVWKLSRSHYDFQLPDGEIVPMRADTLEERGWPKKYVKESIQASALAPTKAKKPEVDGTQTDREVAAENVPDDENQDETPTPARKRRP